MFLVSMPVKPLLRQLFEQRFSSYQKAVEPSSHRLIETDNFL